MTSGARDWVVEHLAGSATELHARPLDAGRGRRVDVLEPLRRAIVLGSTQPVAMVDQGVAAATGTEVVRRRSGGGAVLLVPGDVTWGDVTIEVGP